MQFDCIELTYAQLTKQCREWCKEIEKEFSPKLVVFIAKAGYPIASVIAEYFGSDIAAVSAERKGNGLKKLLSPFFRFTPNFLRNRLIAKELSSGYHSKNAERHVEFLSDLTTYVGTNIPALLVDDSVDTGISLLKVKQEVENKLGFEVRTASLNVWDKSKENISVDYALYKNTIIKAPMSKDSKEHGMFLKHYEEYCSKGS